MRVKRGDYVLYHDNKELGVVKEVTDQGARVWFHLGGTAAMTNFDDFMVIDMFTVVNNTFSNEFAKKSLIERKLRINKNDGQVDDLIDDKDIRPSVKNITEHPWQ